MKKIVIVRMFDTTNKKEVIIKTLHGASDNPNKLAKEIADHMQKNFAQDDKVRFRFQYVELKEEVYVIIDPVVNPGDIFIVGQSENVRRAKTQAEKTLMRELSVSSLPAYNYIEAYIPYTYVLIGVLYNISDNKNQLKVKSIYSIGRDLNKMRISLTQELSSYSTSLKEEIEFKEFRALGEICEVVETALEENHKYMVGFGKDPLEVSRYLAKKLTDSMNGKEIPDCVPMQKWVVK